MLVSEFVEPTQQEISLLAHHLWKTDGCPEGQALKHWHEARELLLQQRILSSSARETAPKPARTRPASAPATVVRGRKPVSKARR